MAQALQQALPGDWQRFISIDLPPKQDAPKRFDPLEARFPHVRTIHLSRWLAEKVTAARDEEEATIFGLLKPGILKGEPIPYTSLGPAQKECLALTLRGLAKQMSIIDLLCGSFLPYQRDPANAFLEYSRNPDPDKPGRRFIESDLGDGLTTGFGATVPPAVFPHVALNNYC